MADAIPVGQPEPQKKTRKVNIQASPSMDENGKVTEGEYAAAARDGIGDGTEFNQEPVSESQRETEMEVAKVAENGEKVIVGFTHRFTRVDH